MARARVSRKGKLSGFTTPTSRALGTVQNTLSVGGPEIFSSAMCPLQFAKASAATLPQQEKIDSADVQRDRVNISGFIGTVASWPSRRCTFDKLGFAAGAPPLTQVRTVGACGTIPRRGPPAAVGRRMAACLGRWRASPQNGPLIRVQRPHIRWADFLNSENRSGPIDFPDRLSSSRGEGCTTTAQSEARNFLFSPAAISAEPPL